MQFRSRNRTRRCPCFSRSKRIRERIECTWACRAHGACLIPFWRIWRQLRLHGNLPIIYIVAILWHTSKEQCCTPRILRCESYSPARPSFPLFFRSRIWLHFKHQGRKGWTLFSVLNGSNFAGLEGGQRMLRKEFPITLRTKSDLSCLCPIQRGLYLLFVDRNI